MPRSPMILFPLRTTGRLDKGLEESAAHGWTVVDMEKDWRVIYPFQR